jgi:hypothetical protein
MNQEQTVRSFGRIASSQCTHQPAGPDGEGVRDLFSAAVLERIYQIVFQNCERAPKLKLLPDTRDSKPEESKGISRLQQLARGL